MMVVDFAAAAFGRRRKISPPPPLGQGFGPNKIQTPALKGRPMERMGYARMAHHSLMRKRLRGGYPLSRAVLL